MCERSFWSYKRGLLLVFLFEGMCVGGADTSLDHKFRLLFFLVSPQNSVVIVIYMMGKLVL